MTKQMNAGSIPVMRKEKKQLNFFHALHPIC